MNKKNPIPCTDLVPTMDIDRFESNFYIICKTLKTMEKLILALLDNIVTYHGELFPSRFKVRRRLNYKIKSQECNYNSEYGLALQKYGSEVCINYTTFMRGGEFG
jgi:hypothetical protein